ncbi:MAG: NAD-dependent epimerase/dehydratase family protein [Alphaproteobacteria bacterium]|nr:NAD-dependent epimerase/dehydratase family protein [Alphaproteobacteria bacterium]
MNIFLAGATGVVGRRLVPLLRDAGHNVTGITRSPEKAAALETLGVRAAVADVYDARALLKAMAASYPDVVVHQLTDLPQTLDPSARPAEFAANARLRIEGTANLMAAASVTGARRVVAQSVSFYYAPGQGARTETDPLDSSPQRQKSVAAVVALEDKVLHTPGIDGVVLRYGRFWGPGTWYAEPKGSGCVHVDAAAHAALLAVTRGAPGVYNVAEDDGAVSVEKAKRELGFEPGFRLNR